MESLLTNKSKKGQLIFGLIAGVAGLIILVIVSFLIVDTLNGANLIADATGTVINESTVSAVNEGGITLASSYTNPTCTVTQCVNSSDGAVVPSANYTATSCAVSYSGAEAGEGFNNSIWKCTYTLIYDSNFQVTTDNLIVDYTTGIDNVSGKIPTVLLVAAVVLLFGAIVMLVQRSRQTTGATGGSL